MPRPLRLVYPSALYHVTANIIISATDNFYSTSPGIDKVEVKIKRTLATGSKLFSRLNVVITP